MIKYIVKGIRIHLGGFLKDRKLPQEFPIIVPLPVFHRKLAVQVLFILRHFLGKRLHLHLHLFPLLIPVLFPVSGHIGMRRLLLLLPEPVVVGIKFRRQPLELPFGKVHVPERPVHALRIENPAPALQPHIELPFGSRRRNTDTGPQKAVDHRLCRNVTGQVPILPVPLFPVPQMAEQTVEHSMEIGPVHQDPVLFIHGRQGLHLEKQGGAVSPQSPDRWIWGKVQRA